MILRATKIITIICLFFLVSKASAKDVQRWQPYDFEFKAKVKTENPFIVSFSAKVTDPDGKSFSVPGFYDGNNTWKVRIAPTSKGKWNLVTVSEIPALNGKKVKFNCVKNTNPNIHGFLRVDKEHPHHFVYDDGTHFFMQCYEYDWLWALDMDKPDVPTVEKTLDLIAGNGFNYVILNSYAHDAKWRLGKTGPDDYGPSLLYPWEGTNENPVHSRMNLAYWQHYDKVMTALFKRGIEAHMLIKVYTKLVNWPVQGSPEEELFFRWLIARYSAYPNIIWDFAKEAHKEPDLAYKQKWMKYIRQTDPYHHLATVHDDDKANDSGAYDDLTDFRADQQHKNYHATILVQRERRNWPVANVESDYECGPGGVKDKTYNSAQTTDKTLRTLWEIAMAGGYTGYYYTYTAWDVIHPLEVPPGYAYMKHFGDFWRSTYYWLLNPSDSLVSQGWCLANEGKEYVVYQNEIKPFTLNIKNASGELAAEWFNPYTDERKPAGTYNNGILNLNPPEGWTNVPVVLHLRAK